MNNDYNRMKKKTTFKGLQLFLIFQNWMKNVQVFYQIILARVMTKKFLGNGEILLRKLKHISTMVMSVDGAVIIAKRLGTIGLLKTTPIWKYSIFFLKSTSEMEPINPKFLTVFVFTVHSRLSRLEKFSSLFMRYLFLSFMLQKNPLVDKFKLFKYSNHH